MKWHFESRVKLISLFFIGVAFFSVVRLYFLQVVHGDSYRTKADSELLSQSASSFDRGSIYFENKDNTLSGGAEIKTGYMLSINPTLIGNAEEIYKKLSSLVNINREDFIARAEKNGDQYEEILRHLPTNVGDKINALKLEGVMIIEDRWRIYPGENIAAHVLGFVGYDGNVINGRYGLERYYEDNLSRNSNAINQNFFIELF